MNWSIIEGSVFSKRSNCLEVLYDWRFRLRFFSLLFLGLVLLPQTSWSDEGQEPKLPAWLGDVLDCSQLRNEIRTRYSGVGKFSQLPSEKKDELRVVLDVTCSERFKHCSFSNCRRSQEEVREDTGLKSSGEEAEKSELATANTASREPEQRSIEVGEEITDNSKWEMRLQAGRKVKREKEYQEAVLKYQEALLSFEELYRKKTERQRALIEKKVAKENERRITWARFMMPDSAQKEPEKTEKPKKRVTQSSSPVPQRIPVRQRPPATGKKQPNSNNQVPQKTTTSKPKPQLITPNQTIRRPPMRPPGRPPKRVW